MAAIGEANQLGGATSYIASRVLWVVGGLLLAYAVWDWPTLRSKADKPRLWLLVPIFTGLIGATWVACVRLAPKPDPTASPATLNGVEKLFQKYFRTVDKPASDTPPVQGHILPPSPCFNPLPFSQKSVQSDSLQYLYVSLLTVEIRNSHSIRLYADTALNGSIEIISPANPMVNVSWSGQVADFKRPKGPVPSSLSMRLAMPFPTKAVCFDLVEAGITVPPSVKPDLTLKFVIKQNLSFEIVNGATPQAINPRYSIQMMNLDNALNKHPDENGLIGLPNATEMLNDYVPTKTALGPISLGNRWQERGLLNRGDRMFGIASIGCPNCTRTHYYYVYAVHGQDGWYCESSTPLSFLGLGRVVIKIEEGMDNPSNYCSGSTQIALEDVTGNSDKQ
jgi:hypothetical protein